MNQPLDFVTKDLDMMMPGGTPMITGPGMYSTTGGAMGAGNVMPPGFNTQSGFNQPPPQGPGSGFRGGF